MKSAYAASLRKLIPGAAVAGVLAFSFVASPASALGGSLAGYGNNCGVKGTGYHDHGKVCPNRPFPGHGIGVLRILAGEGLAPAGESSAGGTNAKQHNKANVTVTLSNGAATSTTNGETQSTSSIGRGHGHGKALGLGRSHHSED